MFQPTIVHSETPNAVGTFVSQKMDLYFADVHAMLRLPRPEVGITQACNFALAAVLVNVISDVSTVLYAPPPNRKNTGKNFQQALRDFPVERGASAWRSRSRAGREVGVRDAEESDGPCVRSAGSGTRCPG
jgi:hypothetical protein